MSTFHPLSSNRRCCSSKSTHQCWLKVVFVGSFLDVVTTNTNNRTKFFTDFLLLLWKEVFIAILLLSLIATTATSMSTSTCCFLCLLSPVSTGFDLLILLVTTINLPLSYPAIVPNNLLYVSFAIILHDDERTVCTFSEMCCVVGIDVLPLTDDKVGSVDGVNDLFKLVAMSLLFVFLVFVIVVCVAGFTAATVVVVGTLLLLLSARSVLLFFDCHRGQLLLLLLNVIYSRCRSW